MGTVRRPPVNSLIRELISLPQLGAHSIMGQLIDTLGLAAKADAHAILRLHPGSGTARILAANNLLDNSENNAGTIEVPGITALISGVESGRIRSLSGRSHEDPFLEREKAGELLLACMDFGTERLVTVALRRSAEKFTAADKERFHVLSGVINLVIGCSYDTGDHLQHRDIDPLTGLGLYPAFHDTLDKEISRSRRRSGKITVGILTIAGDVRFSENQSTPGDPTLLLVAQTLVKQLRNFDTVIRYSSGEFALVLPDIGGLDAEKVLSRVVEAVRSSNGKTGVNIYAGISCYPEDGSTAERLIETAEAALNKAVEERSDVVMRWKE